MKIQNFWNYICNYNLFIYFDPLKYVFEFCWVNYFSPVQKVFAPNSWFSKQVNTSFYTYGEFQRYEEYMLNSQGTKNDLAPCSGLLYQNQSWPFSENVTRTHSRFCVTFYTYQSTSYNLNFSFRKSFQCYRITMVQFLGK